ncbi:MAG: ArgE/DapE family deacylase [Acidobacteriota bacterium]|nr:ArgE/DapE family deacylase [Acidobacteriota bacterium]
MANKTISLLRDLIAIDSVNPSLVPGGAGEKEIAAAVESYLRTIGMDVTLTEVAPGRQNVVGVLEGQRPGKSLMFCGHLDTVGVEGMDHPFDPVARDGRIYGRGSGDMKGGLAAMLEAAGTLAQNGGWGSGRLIVAAVVDEEYESIGAEALIKDWQADAAVVTEPTGLVVAVGHKGFSWIEVTTEGRAAHGSRPLEGRDAILNMGRFLHQLQTLNQKLQSQNPHPLLGQPSLHASLIEGGREMSTYPDRCVLKMERRNVSGEQPGIALAEVDEILESLKREDPKFAGYAKLLFERPPYETPAENEFPQLLEGAVRSIGHTTCREGMTYWTDAAVLGSAGIPSVIFGPGGFGYHGLEEYVNVDDVLACRDALVIFARDFCH